MTTSTCDPDSHVTTRVVTGFTCMTKQKLITLATFSFQYGYFPTKIQSNYANLYFRETRKTSGRETQTDPIPGPYRSCGVFSQGQ